MKHAICIGLTKLDPEFYGGWDGNCPGCDRDAARFATLCHDRGFDGIHCLINAAATKATILATFKDAAKKLSAGDLLVLYTSGHGGQQRDFDGDEDDGKDETLCWYDGEVVDDDIAACLRTLPKGIKVLTVSDTCNSGTNYRGRKKSTPAVIRAKNTFKGSLVHFGGCADGRSSYGAEDGGVWTLALLDAMSRARKPLTYREWFERAISRVTWQKPVLGEWGPSFANEIVFSGVSQ